MVNVTHVHHRSAHHSQKSGYGRISDFMEAQVIYGQTRFPYRLAKWIGNFHDQKKGIYNTHSVLKEWELFRKMKFSNEIPQVIHYLNAERDVRHLVNRKSCFSNAFFCGTFHKPPDILKSVISDPSKIQKLDGAITVGVNQVDFLKEWMKNDRVQFIPHGVDTTYFVPGEKSKGQRRIVFVGQHLRDFNTFNETVKVIVNKYSDVRIDAVINKPYVKNIEPNDALTIHCGLNDDKLLGIYQEATLMFLPLLEVTACNSILEALSCGLPIITTDVGSNAEYLRGTINMLVEKQDVDACVSAISEVLEDEVNRNKLRDSSREKALTYDWKEITHQIHEFYFKLSNSLK